MPENVTGFQLTGNLKKSLIDLPYFNMLLRRSSAVFREAPKCVRLVGCLRTPKGGGSRPHIIVVKGADVRTRLLAPAEAASLMGLRASYRLPEVYEFAFRVIGDGVAVPVVAFCARSF